MENHRGFGAVWLFGAEISFVQVSQLGRLPRVPHCFTLLDKLSVWERAPSDFKWH